MVYNKLLLKVFPRCLFYSFWFLGLHDPITIGTHETLVTVSLVQGPQDLGKHYRPCYTEGCEVSGPRSPAGIAHPWKQRNLSQSYKNLHLQIQGVNNSPEVEQKHCGPAGNQIHISELQAQVQLPHLPRVPINAIKYLFCPATSRCTLGKDGWLHTSAPAGHSGAGTVNEDVSCSTTVLPWFFLTVLWLTAPPAKTFQQFQ